MNSNFQSKTIQLFKDYLNSACKPRNQHKIGTEFELITTTRDFRPKQLDADQGLYSMLGCLSQSADWQAKEIHGGKVISLNREEGDITLEPGCQMELSARPHQDIAAIQSDFNAYMNSLRPCQDIHDIRYFGVGVNPLHHADDIKLSPKPRYQIMNNLFSSKGTLGKYMMRTSSSIQVCIDFESPDDLLQQLQLSLRIAPFAIALFANSPFFGGEHNGYLCNRSRIWHNTDPDRCGIPQVWMNPDSSLESVLDFALKSPPIFVDRGQGYECAQGKSFYELFEDVEDENEILSQLETHLGQLFFESRFKKYLEIRCIDGQIPRFQMCVPAFIKGLFYHLPTRLETIELLKSYSDEQIYQAYLQVARSALQTKISNHPILDPVKELLDLACKGLNELANEQNLVRSEEVYLHPLLEIVHENSYSPADYLLRAWEKDFGGNLKETMTLMEY